MKQNGGMETTWDGPHVRSFHAGYQDTERVEHTQKHSTHTHKCCRAVSMHFSNFPIEIEGWQGMRKKKTARPHDLFTYSEIRNGLNLEASLTIFIQIGSQPGI